MKTKLLICAICVICGSLWAEDITTRDGRTFKDVKILNHDAAAIEIMNSTGVVRLPLANLPDDVQKKFGYDPANAAAQAAADQSARSARAASAPLDQLIRQRDLLQKNLDTTAIALADAREKLKIAQTNTIREPIYGDVKGGVTLKNPAGGIITKTTVERKQVGTRSVPDPAIPKLQEDIKLYQAQIASGKKEYTTLTNRIAIATTSTLIP